MDRIDPKGLNGTEKDLTGPNGLKWTNLHRMEQNGLNRTKMSPIDQIEPIGLNGT